MALVLGLDVGTQSVRAVVSDESGTVVASSAVALEDSVNVAGLPPGCFEQDPEGWWRGSEQALCRAVESLLSAGSAAADIRALAVDSTSGTVVAVDESGAALRPAIMYSDTRAADEASQCNAAGEELTAKLGYQFNSSFGLPKILWIVRHEPDIFERAAKLINPADFIVGKLTGEFGRSDNSNCLKMGYDLVDLRWPAFIGSRLGIDAAKLPRVVSPGETLGRVSGSCAEGTGLAEGTLLVGGVSDGTAGFVASGAAAPGDWNSTLGTTLVLRGVSRGLVRDPKGRIYCHRHPDGFWLPGGASSVGGECLVQFRAGTGPCPYESMDAAAARLVPTKLLVYPLARRGERLPFVDPDAEGFVVGEPGSREELYAAHLEGVAFVERWCLELVEQLGAQVGERVFATGGGAKSGEWTRIRASVLGKRVIRPKIAESAMGAAIAAASRTLYPNLTEASGAMVSHDVVVEPDEALARAYDERYRVFRAECARRGLGGEE